MVLRPSRTITHAWRTMNRIVLLTRLSPHSRVLIAPPLVSKAHITVCARQLDVNRAAHRIHVHSPILLHAAPWIVRRDPSVLPHAGKLQPSVQLTRRMLLHTTRAHKQVHFGHAPAVQL
jgi:hypothetical protein